jgi:PAS domain S-box-containing protein
MSKKAEPDDIRSKALELLADSPPMVVPARSAEELLHELQVHQIELEMQNDELRRAQIALEESRDRYLDLYEFAPVGYLTLNRHGMITRVNLTGAALLGVERKKLLNRRFSGFVTGGDSHRWYSHFLDTLQHDGHHNCELALQNVDGSRIHARIDCLHMEADSTSSVRITLTDISERKRAEQQMRELSAHLQTVREEEKASFAREIHDELGSTLAALKMDAHWLADKLPAKAEMQPLQECAKSMVELLDNAVKATRRIIIDLRPPILDDRGLMAALEVYAEQFHKRTGTECRVVCARRKDKGCEDCRDCESNLNKALSVNLFRIFQETLTNVARHSGASRVDAELYQDAREVILSISDNGCGLPEGHTIVSTSYGLRGMRERIEQLSGKIRFDSQPGSGFSVTVTVPLSAAPH